MRHKRTDFCIDLRMGTHREPFNHRAFDFAPDKFWCSEQLEPFVPPGIEEQRLRVRIKVDLVTQRLKALSIGE